MIFLFKKHIIFKISKQLYSIRNLSKKIQDDLVIKERNSPNFFSKLLGLPFNKAQNILDNHPQLLYIDTKDIEKTVDTLKSYNYTINDIVSKPMILYLNSLTIENRYDTLKECGCSEISIIILAKFLTVMNRTIENLKINLVIPENVNVQKKLENNFKDIEIHLNYRYDDNIQLVKLRQEILNEYLRKKLNLNDNDLKILWKTYVRLKHRNYKSICEMIDILQNQLNFSNERIVNNSFVLYGDPKNVKQLLHEIKTIGNEDFKNILHKRPKILMSSCDSILKTIKYIKEYDISETAILKCLEILTLGSETVKKRLEELNNVNEFCVLKTNPRILRLIHYLNKAKHRLDYLNKLKIRYVSLDILSSSTQKFERFAFEGIDSHKGRDIIIFLAGIFGKTNSEVRKLISRHPNWCHISIFNMKKSYDFLISKLFTTDVIFENIYLLLYPVKRIEEKLFLLNEKQIYDDLKLDVNYTQITNSQILKLCLYLIELEYHFTGDGIWMEQSTQPVENFSTIIPDFFESTPKTYRYGSRHLSAQKLAESKTETPI